MTRSADWRGMSRNILRATLGILGAVLTTTGRVLRALSLLAQTLRARLGPQ